MLMKNALVHPAKVESKWFVYLGAFIALFIMISSMYGVQEESLLSLIFPILLILIVIGLLYMMARKTSYVLTKECIEINMLFYQHKLPYSYIDNVKRSRYPSAGRRMAWAAEGLVLYYASGSMLYIAPEDREAFMEDLKRYIPESKFINQ